MTDYCECGYKATRLCTRCRTPTCTVVSETHVAEFPNRRAADYLLDVRARNWAEFGACPSCLVEIAGELLAQYDLEDLIRNETAFERACQIATGYLRPTPLTAGPRRQHQPLFEFYRWRGPFVPQAPVNEFARAFVLKHSRVAPLQDEIVDSAHADRLRALLPEEFIDDAGRALDSGEALLILRVDETAAFRVRELLEEDTRSQWTIAVPPQLNERTGRATSAGSSGVD